MGYNNDALISTPMRKLEQITVYRLRVPLTRPYRLAFGAVEHYDTMVVEIMNRDGARGLGEATILTGYTDETIEESWRAARQFASELANDEEPEARSKLIEFAESHPFTATAFGTAREMLNGTRLLSVSHKTRVPLVGLLNATEEDAMRAELEQLLAAGYSTIKVKVGFNASQDARVISSVQKLANGRARIRIDANQGYSVEQGVAFVRALDPRDIELFEQPCAAGDWESQLAVAKVSPVPLMLDESIYGIADIEKAAALEAAAYIKLKLMKFVTLEALVEAIQRIRTLGMRPVLGNGVACDLSCWMEGCIAAKYIDNAGEMNGFLKARAQLFGRRLEVHDGALWLEPDFRPRLDVANVKRYLVDTVTCTPGTASRAA